MVYKQINIVTSASAAENLPQEVTALIEIARQAAQKAYAPYSEFHVGAAILLENGEVLSGSYQESAA